MLLRQLFFLLLFLPAADLVAQPVLHSVGIQGHKRTRVVFIEHFIVAKSGVPVDSAALDESVRNILNTNLFAAAEWSLKDTLGQVQAVIDLKEKWTVYPTASWGVIDDNFWVEAGWRDNHFLGRGIRYSIVLRYYDRFAVEGNYRAPYWFGRNLGMEANWFFGRTVEPIQLNDHHERFNQDRQMFNLLGSYALKPNNLLFAGYEYELSEYQNRDGAPESFAADFNEVQRKHQMVLRHHNRNHFNILEQYVTGWANDVVLKSAFVSDGGRWYPFFRNDFKVFFKPWNSGNIGNRLRMGVAENHPSVFAPFIQDSFLNVRGIGNKPFRGTAELTNNLELRQTIYNHRLVALQAVAFCDYSVVRPPGGNFEDMFHANNNRLFAGVGGRIFFKRGFDFILRMDYGFSLTDGKGGFVLGAGQYF